MGFSSYLKSHLCDYLFCLMETGALTYTLFSGFYATQPLQAWPDFLLAVASCATVCAALLCVAYTLRTAVIGGSLLAVALAAAVIAVSVASAGANPVDDVEGNYAIGLLLVIGSCLVVFLLSRTYPGSVVLAVAGMGCCALIEYLYWYGHLAATLIAFIGAVGLIVVRRASFLPPERAQDASKRDGGSRHGGTSPTSADGGEVADGTVFLSVGVLGVVLAVAALAVGFGVYKLVVEPLEPPRVQMALVVEHRRVEEVNIVGTGAVSADAAGDSGNDANGEEDPTDREADDAPRDTLSGGLMSLLGMDIDQAGDDGATSALQRAVLLALLALGLLVLLVVALIVGRKLVRRHRFNKMTAQESEAAVRSLYLFFLERFEKMKVARPENQSLRDFVCANEQRFAEFERFKPEGGAGLVQLTDTYIGVMYGHENVDEAQLAAFTDYYRLFYKNARRFVGRLRYLGKFFTL